MSPDAGYTIGDEKGAGVHGNAPMLVYDFWPLEFSLISIPFISGLYPPVEFSMVGVASAVLGLALVFFLVLTIFQLIIRIKLRILHSNTELELLLEKARNRLGCLGYFRTPEIWIYHSMKPILVPLSGFFNKSLLISDSAVDDLLASPEHGEVVLADALVSLEDRTLSTWIPVFMFVLLSLILYPWIGLTTEMTSTLLLIIYWAIAFAVAFSIVIPRKESKNPILVEYGIHSNAARCVVFRNEQPTDLEISEITNPPRLPRHSLSRMENASTFAVAFVVSQLVWIFLQNLSLTLSFDNIALLPNLHLMLPFSVSIITLLVIDYYLGKMIQRGRTDDMTLSTHKPIQ